MEVNIMIKETIKYPRFSETDFIRLYCAINFQKGLSPIIKPHELETKLYEFYSLPDFEELFQDICPKKDYIDPENSYLDLETAISRAQTFGLLTQIRGVEEEIRFIISYDEEIAQEIISNTDTKMVDKMTNLFTVMFGLDSDSKKKQQSQGPLLVRKMS